VSPDSRNSKPIPHIQLPFKEVIADVFRVTPPEAVKGGESETKGDNWLN
jgi:hypothetical protein